MVCNHLLLLLLTVLPGISSGLVPSVWQSEIHIPAEPCDGFSCAELSTTTADGLGICDVEMFIVVGYTMDPTNPGDYSATLFLPARRGYAGNCQSLTVHNVTGTYGASLQSSDVQSELIDGVLDGYRVQMVFDRTVSPSHFANISYTCKCLVHLNLMDTAHETALMHIYRMDLNMAVPATTASISIVFPFENSTLLPDGITIPKRVVSAGKTTFTFDGANVDLFGVSFSFLFTQYDRSCGVRSYTTIIRYGLIGGAIVGAVALVAALSWFIVKRIIKKRVSPTSRITGQEIDLLTDEDTTDNEMDNLFQ